MSLHHEPYFLAWRMCHPDEHQNHSTAASDTLLAQIPEILSGHEVGSEYLPFQVPREVMLAFCTILRDAPSIAV